MKKFEKYLIDAIYLASKGLFGLFAIMFSLIGICSLVALFINGEIILGLMAGAAAGVLAFANYSMI